MSAVDTDAVFVSVVRILRIYMRAQLKSVRPRSLAFYFSKVNKGVAFVSSVEKYGFYLSKEDKKSTCLQ